MKNKKFKLERNILLEVSKVLNTILMRIRLILPHFSLEQKECFNSCIIYYNSILNYYYEINNLINRQENSILLSKEELNHMNQLKNIVNVAEKEISNYTSVSFKLH
jgi:hypothetical protein